MSARLDLFVLRFVCVLAVFCVGLFAVDAYRADWSWHGVWLDVAMLAMNVYNACVIRAAVRSKSEPFGPTVCLHDWANWSNPEPTEEKVTHHSSMDFGRFATVERVVMQQSRVCLLCNLYERRTCS